VFGALLFERPLTIRVLVLWLGLHDSSWSSSWDRASLLELLHTMRRDFQKEVAESNVNNVSCIRRRSEDSRESGLFAQIELARSNVRLMLEP
jgi:hypothetical protein